MKLHKYIPFMLIPAVPLVAQDNASDSSEEVFELSPFVVDAAQDTGYYASQTLAGTRLKTDVRDVGSSIQILTSEFLDDVGAESVNDLFLYTTNTEAAGLGGNFTDYTVGATSLGDEAFRVDPEGAQRVRGLTSADRARNYFPTRLPGDRYLTERVEINRGANSILFGLGSPAGIVNTSLKQARYSDFGELRHRFDSEGTQRVEFDYNKELIEDKLAIRVAALADRSEYRQEPAFEDQDRYYINLRADPWKGAGIRAFYENGEREANRPSLIFPAETMSFWFDNNADVRSQIQSWMDDNGVLDINGNPLQVPGNTIISWDPFLNDLYSRNETRLLGATDVNNDGVVDAADDIARVNAYRNMLVYPQANSERYISHPNTSRQILRVFQFDETEAGGAPGGGDAIQSNVNTRNWIPDIATLPDYIDPDGNGVYSTLYQSSIQPWRDRDVSLVPSSIQNLDIFDFTENLVSGNSAFQNDDWKHYNVAFEQLLFDDHFGIEVAYDEQEYFRDTFVPFQAFTGVFIDLMESYYGVPNPNYGRPFIQARTKRIEIEDERDSFRVTSFLRFNPAEIWDNSGIAKWLGEHTFTGLYNTYSQWNSRSTFGEYFTDDAAGSTFRANDTSVSDSNRQFNYIVYLSDQNITQLNSVDEVRLNRMRDQQIYNPGQGATILDLDPETGIPFERRIASDSFLDGYGTDEQDVDSVAAVWNSYWLNRHIVGLVGWRKDKAYAASYDAPLFNDGSNEGLPDLDDMRLTSGGEEVTVETLSWSVVAHMPDKWMPEGTGLSFHYGLSENFSLGASARDLYGNVVESPRGETKEYGLTADLFDGKLYARLNWFETDLKNRQLEGQNNLYNVFINRILLHSYANLRESEVAGFIPPSTDPETGQEFEGTPNFDLGMQALGALEQIIPQAIIEEANIDQPDGLGNAAENREDLSFGDTEDVTAEGVELEITYNPIRNWRISINVAKQETVTANYSPRLRTLLELTDPYLDSATGSIKDLRFFPNYADDPILYMTGPFVDNNSIGERSEQLVYNNYRNAVTQQGKASNEQRKWRVNIITNYNFRDGFLDGFGIGAAYRWQDGAVIGYPTELIDGQLISDIDNPHVAPSETSVDLWLRYRTKLFNEKIDWTIELRVQNINTDADNLIPVVAKNSEEYEVAVWRSGPPRIWMITNTFKF
jgi:hypothetical protein